MTISQKLISIEVNQLRNIPFIGSYKNKIISALEKIFDYHNLEDTSQICKIYEIEEKKKEINDSFSLELYGNILDENEQYKYKNLQYIVQAIYQILDIISDYIYYICFYNKSDKYEGYELETHFYKIVDDLIYELDLPKLKIYSLHSEKINTNHNSLKSIDSIEGLIGFSWYQKNKDEVKLKNYEWCNLNNTKDVEDYLNSFKIENNSKKTEKEKQQQKQQAIRFKKLFDTVKKERESSRFQKASEYYKKWHGIHRAISIDAKVDDQYNFNSVGYSLFESLTNKKELACGKGLKKEFIDTEISTNISNENINIILQLFNQLGLCGKLVEFGEAYSNEKKTLSINNNNSSQNQKFYWADTKLDNLTIEIGDKAVWNPEHNKVLEDLLIHFKYDLTGLNYQNGSPVIRI